MPGASHRKDQAYLTSQQYKNVDNLRARMALHERFSTNKEDFARWVFDHIEASDKARVLELGTGPANFWVKNFDRIPATWHVTLTDLSPGMLEAAQKATDDIHATFAYQVADAQEIPFEDDTFDAVIANHMLYHVPDELKAVKEIRRVLKPGGRLYAATNGREHMQELEGFITEQFGALGEGFMSLDPQAFQLENGAEKLAQVFDTVDLHVVKNNTLQVTEAEPFMAYVLSMQRFQNAGGDVRGGHLQNLIDKAHKEVEKRLERGPIHITKSTGLFIAS
ncbi:hypothetical protein BH24DEI2_BH24DEI2_28850 [soil metagenome]